MSTLIGAESERWSLPRAIDALGESARQAGHPGFVWLAGFFYPTLTLGLDLGWDGPLTYSFHTVLTEMSEKGEEARGVWKVLQNLPIGALAFFVLAPCVGILFIPCFRLVAGLTRVGPARAWETARAERTTPSLSAVWSAGRGLTLPTFGLWLQLALMFGGALLLGSLPASALASAVEDPLGSPKTAVLMGAMIIPILVVLMGYALALSVLNQLALHSLAHNRRGVYSALLHGWRIMRNDPWATCAGGARRPRPLPDDPDGLEDVHGVLRDPRPRRRRAGCDREGPLDRLRRRRARGLLGARLPRARRAVARRRGAGSRRELSQRQISIRFASPARISMRRSSTSRLSNPGNPSRKLCVGAIVTFKRYEPADRISGPDVEPCVQRQSSTPLPVE
jgi:hypothetical protein